MADQKGFKQQLIASESSQVSKLSSTLSLRAGLECQNAFARCIFHPNTDAKKRHAITPSNMAKINKECIALDDDIRWLVAIIFDTGMRLSEAAGLMLSDLQLDEEIPYIHLIPHPHRRLKTASSERKIPLSWSVIMGRKAS